VSIIYFLVRYILPKKSSKKGIVKRERKREHDKHNDTKGQFRSANAVAIQAGRPRNKSDE
jgi:hypothetical protein